MPQLPLLSWVQYRNRHPPPPPAASVWRCAGGAPRLRSSAAQRHAPYLPRHQVLLALPDRGCGRGIRWAQVAIGHGQGCSVRPPGPRLNRRRATTTLARRGVQARVSSSQRAAPGARGRHDAYLVSRREVAASMESIARPSNRAQRPKEDTQKHLVDRRIAGPERSRRRLGPPKPARRSAWQTARRPRWAAATATRMWGADGTS